MIRAVFYFEDDSVTIHSENTKLVEKKFQKGIYKASPDNQGNLHISLVKLPEIHEPYPNQRSSEIIEGVTKFLNEESKQVCNEMGFIYKLNTLLYGTQGVGKTALINYICKGLIDYHNAIVIRVDSPSYLDISWTLGEEIRKIQDNLIVFVMDEFDAFVQKGQESYVKTLLDGNRSINNSIVFAATNYIDRIPTTFKERPSRFRFVSEIRPIDDKSIIKDLILKVISKTKKQIFTIDEIDKIVDEIKATTVDDVKTLILDKLLDIKLGLPTKGVVGFKRQNESIDPNLDIDEFAELINAFGKYTHIEDIAMPMKYSVEDKPVREDLFNHKSIHSEDLSDD